MRTETQVVAHICYGGEGGQQSAVRTLVKQFDRIGLPSAVVALGHPQVLKDDSHEWSHPKCFDSIPITRQGDLRSMVRVTSSIRRTRPRVILCHSHRHAIAGVIGQVLAGCRPRLIVVEHQSTHLRSTKDNLLSGLAVAVSRGVVFLTEQYRQDYPLLQLQRILRRPGFVVPNGIAASGRRVSNETRFALPDPATKRVGMVSRLVSSKQHDVLIRAMHHLHKRPGYEKVHLFVAGEGPTMSQLVWLAEELEVAEFVHFLGHIPVSKVPEFLGELDVYAHATLGEGFSIALLEAAEAGVPIVVSDVPGVKEFFVDGETAALVPPSDADAMASGIAQVLEPPLGDRLAVAAREWVLSNYSADHVAARYLDVLREVDPGGAW